MIKKALLVFIALLAWAGTFAQEKKAKPKVGLVLSGGGAKGLAHIGVIKVLEEQGVEISYIGGTSMGAIIGGLYAAGYSGRELDSIFTHLDSDALLRDYTPRGSKNFFEKRNDEQYALTLPFKKFRIGFPTALSKGLYNYTTINRLTDNVRHIRDFSKLPVPFVCIATDIETGEEIVLNQGILSDAILASGAFPSLYYPVEINGRLLIDGGITNNYPIEEVRKMGADIIIGVDVQDGLKNRAEINGATGLLVQINNYQMIKEMEEKRCNTDIYIKPDITEFSIISFEEANDIIQKGEQAAKAMLDTLNTISTGIPVQRVKQVRQDSLHIEQIRISGLKNHTRSYVIGKLSFKPGANLTYNKFNTGISNLNATQNFNAISYSFEKGEKGDILNVNLRENPVDRYLKFGLHYDGLYKSAILVNLTQKNLLFRNDVASLDVILGDNFRYNFNYYMDNGFYMSYGLHSRFNRFNRNVATDYNNGVLLDVLAVNSINIDFTDFTNQAYVQTIFAQRFLLGAGLEMKYLKIKSETLQRGSPVFDNSNYFSAYTYLKFDSYDNKYFPKEGWYFSGEAKSFLASSDYTNNFDRFSIIKAEGGTAKRIARNITLEVQAETGFSVGEETIPYFDFVLGGYGYYMTNNFRHFYGYDFLSLSGNSYIKGALTVDYEFLRKNHLNLTANFANIGNRLYDEGNVLSIPQYSGYAVGYGMETIIGPLEVKQSWSPQTNDYYTWFSIGFWF